MSQSKAYVYRHVVSYEDTNAMGNVYFARYVAWQGKVREMFLQEKADAVCRALANRELILATKKVECDYDEELFAFDEVRIEMRLHGRPVGGQFWLVFKYWKLGVVKSSLVATGRQKVRCLTPIAGENEPKSMLLPDYFAVALSEYR